MELDQDKKHRKNKSLTKRKKKMLKLVEFFSSKLVRFIKEQNILVAYLLFPAFSLSLYYWWDPNPIDNFVLVLPL